MLSYTEQLTIASLFVIEYIVIDIIAMEREEELPQREAKTSH